jgi:nucleotide-binding universal stress UspA family protein
MRTTVTHTILVPLDGSAFAEQALAMAMPLARATQRRLRLCHVRLLPLWPDEIVEPDTVEAMKHILHAEGETYLREVQRRIEAPDLRVDVAVLPGDVTSVGESLQRHIEENPVDMVILGTHGRGGVQRAWLGSVADYLVRHLTIPVLLVRSGMLTPSGDRRLLVPLDGSPLAEQALEEACALAAALHQDIVLFRVVTPVVYPMPGVDAPYVGIDVDLTTITRREAEEYLGQVEERIEARGIKCSAITLLGNSAAEGIIEMARPAHFSHVIMSTHGRGGFKRLLLGSVADKVIRGAAVPVLVIRPQLTTVTPRFVESGLPAIHSYQT